MQCVGPTQHSIGRAKSGAPFNSYVGSDSVRTLLRRYRWKTLIFVGAALAFPLIVRLAIRFFHPKDGELLQFASMFLGKDSLRSLSSSISLPVYDLLVHSVWQGSLGVFMVMSLTLSVVVTVLTPNPSFEEGRRKSASPLN